MSKSLFVSPPCGSERTNMANAWDNVPIRRDFPMQGFRRARVTRFEITPE